MRTTYLLSLCLAGGRLVAQAQQVPLLVQSANPNQTASLYAGETIELQPGFGTTTEGFEARLAPGAVGEWSAVFAWGQSGQTIVGIHTHVLPNGMVLSWQGHNDNVATPTQLHSHTYQWNGSTSSPGFFHINHTKNIFCSGHSFLANGKLLVAGGHNRDTIITNPTTGVQDTYIMGLKQVSTFNFTSPFTAAWQDEASMTRARWYPTVTTLSNGDALSIGGETYPQRRLTDVHKPEILRNGTWSFLSDAVLQVPLYPWMFAAPNGKVFMAGCHPITQTRYLSTTGTGAWSPEFAALAPGVTYTGWRYYGSPVMYKRGQLLLTGGEDIYNAPSYPVTETTQLIDLVNGPTPPAGTDRAPLFRPGASMLYRRMHHNATVLPDGTVLVTGGTTTALSDEDNYAVLAAEIWTPPAGTTGGGSWARAASMRTPRLYHSTAVLLPDGRVLTAGGGKGGKFADHPDAEVFSPPYLFKGARPQISYAPTNVVYGRPFTVRSPEWASITRVTWVRLSSVTHSLNMNQRFDELVFQSTNGALSVTPPATPNDCPPGHYMLFLLNASGVPSPAAIVAINPGGTCTPTATVSTTVPAVGAGVCNVTATATVSGTDLGTDYRWTLNGVYEPGFDGMTSVYYELDRCAPQINFSVQVSPVCPGAAVTAQGSAGACFNFRCGCVGRL